MKHLIVLGASVGGLQALQQIIAAMPPDLQACVLIVMHTGPYRSELPQLLARHCQLPVRHARNGEALADGMILVAPPDHHLQVVHDGAAIDPLFRTAAEVAGSHAIGVVLTGYLDDGSVGLKAIKECGGTAIVQHPTDAEVPDMPANALRHVAADYCVRLHEIGPLLVRLTRGERPKAVSVPSAPLWVRVENSFSRSMANMETLNEVGAPSTYTCPDCSGTLWHMYTPPVHFRCHTGHAYTIDTLMALQGQIVEQAMWAAVRALQEKAMLARQLAADPGGEEPRDYNAMADQAQRRADQLRAILEQSPPPA
jgi:two-component system chemotaxis response regulator CheB